MDLKSSGVYLIFNKITEKYYFGSTIKSFKERWHSHRYALDRGIHGNYKIQQDYNKYGHESFIYAVLLRSNDNEEIRVTEQRLLDIYFGKENCYNLQPKVDTYGKAAKVRDFPKDYNNYLVSPDGVIYERVTNLSAFARENGLQQTTLLALVKGNVHTHKGWTLLYPRIMLPRGVRKGSTRTGIGGRPRKIDDTAIQAKVIELRGKGYSYRKIGKMVNLSYTSVQRIILESS